MGTNDETSPLAKPCDPSARSGRVLLHSGAPIIVAWGRPHGYEGEPLHALVAINDHGSNVTACSGRWSATDPGEIFFGARVTQYPKCRGCCALTGDTATIPEIAAYDWPSAHELGGEG